MLKKIFLIGLIVLFAMPAWGASTHDFGLVPGKLLKTGQTTQYSSELDDGYYQKGLTKSYTVLSTGAQNGTSNIDLAHYTAGAGNITFGGGTAQVETAEIVGTIEAAGAGNITVTVTAAGKAELTSGKVVQVEVANNDTASQVAGKVRTVLQADNDVGAANGFFTITGAGANIIATAKANAANDATMNIAYANGTALGLTPDATSEDTTAGVKNTTIVDNTGGLVIFLTADVITTSSTSNPGPFTISGGANATTITCSTCAFIGETPAGAITFYKREAHTNAIVLDNNTGLMWSQEVTDKMGTASEGKMPWTGVVYDIFAYAASANLASLGGYTDWRIPNLYEFRSLLIIEAPTSYPNATYFPTWPAVAYDYWTNTTSVDNTSNAFYVTSSTGRNGSSAKTTSSKTILVRGGG